MIKSMVVGFEIWVVIWEHLHSFSKVKYTQSYPKTLWMRIKNFDIPPIVSWTVGSQSVVLPISGFSISSYNCAFPVKGTPVQTLWVASFGFPLYEICVQNKNRGIKFEILVEDSDTGSPSSITVRIECLFACQFWNCELCMKNQLKGDSKGSRVWQKFLFRDNWNWIFRLLRRLKFHSMWGASCHPAFYGSGVDQWN